MTAPTDRTAGASPRRPAVPRQPAPAGAETGPHPPCGPVSPTPAVVARGAAAGPDPGRGGAGGPDPGKGGPPNPRCVCGHLVMFHNYGKRAGVQVRTGCSISSGPKAVPCGCPLYQEA